MALVAAQALLPLGLIAWNEQALASGTDVTLKTAPVDPVDLFRGRYVTLSYEISALPTPYDAGDDRLCPAHRRRRDMARRHADATHARTRERSSAATSRRPGRIEFGIGRYFTDEDEARRLEAAGPLLVGRRARATTASLGSRG